jgi:hypothetical protein
MKYFFANPAHTLVCDESGNLAFEWERGQHISNVHGGAAEAYRFEGCPPIAPYDGDDVLPPGLAPAR